MITLRQIPEIEKDRNVKQSATDFGSTFRKHEEMHQKFLGKTSYHDAYSRPLKDNAQETIQRFYETQNKYSGGNERPIERQGPKMTSVLTGEKFKNLPEPKDNTGVQRSWLPYPDRGLDVALQNLQTNETVNTITGFKPLNPLQTYRQNNAQILPYDIATSLPLQEGEYPMRPKYTNPGQYRHVRTDVTLIRNQPLTKK